MVAFAKGVRVATVLVAVGVATAVEVAVMVAVAEVAAAVLEAPAAVLDDKSKRTEYSIHLQ